MNRRLMLGAASAFAVVCAPVAAAQDGPGYLSRGVIVRLAAAVPPPPAEGSAEAAADRVGSERYRALETGDRWLLATSHAELRPALAPGHFDCALGVRLAGTSTPRLTAMFETLLHDASGAAGIARLRALRPRPVAVDPDRIACQRLTATSRASASWPSTSAAVAVAYAEAMAVVAPDQAAAVRAIGGQIAVSGLVCGMHYPSDVAAGETLGQAVFAEVAGTPAFQADVTAARGEIAAARAAGLTHPGCAAERAALAASLP